MLRASASTLAVGRRLGDEMLRFAILVAVAAAFLAMITPDLVSTFLTGANSAAPAPGPVRANAALIAPAPADSGETIIEADPGGQYAADVDVNGQRVKMLVDTGATMVVISYETASRLGLSIVGSDYTGRAQTANGVAAVAPVTLREVTIGQIYLGDVKALVAGPNAGAMNLLGMSFLRRLASVGQRSGRLILRR
jgi:aspartyl protease family protein